MLKAQRERLKDKNKNIEKKNPSFSGIHWTLLRTLYPSTQHFLFSFFIIYIFFNFPLFLIRIVNEIFK